MSGGVKGRCQGSSAAVKPGTITVTLWCPPARHPILYASLKWGGKGKDPGGLTQGKFGVSGATRIFHVFIIFLINSRKTRSQFPFKRANHNIDSLQQTQDELNFSISQQNLF